jgi:hypothetical protein
MIAPKVIGDAALAARIAAIPAALRAALAGEADRLGRALSNRAAPRAAGGRVSIAVESTAEDVTLTMRRSDPAGNPGTRRGPRPAPVARRSPRSRRTTGAHVEPPDLKAALEALVPEVRGALSAAFRRVFVR